MSTEQTQLQDEAATLQDDAATAQNQVVTAHRKAAGTAADAVEAQLDRLRDAWGAVQASQLAALEGALQYQAKLIELVQTYIDRRLAADRAKLDARTLQDVVRIEREFVESYGSAAADHARSANEIGIATASEVVKPITDGLTRAVSELKDRKAA